MAKTTPTTTTMAESAKETATPTTTIKNFKSSSEVTDFYRFIHDKKLRAEAKQIIDVVLKKITPPKKRGRKKAVKTLH
jgi:hypothetical protein